MQSSLLIFRTLGDGSLYRVDSATTPQDAREHVEAFARFWPSIYIICDEITGEQLFIDATGEMKNQTRCWRQEYAMPFRILTQLSAGRRRADTREMRSASCLKDAGS